MVVALGLIVLILGISYCGKGFYEDNFSVSQTRALKGLFAIYIVFHHLCTYLADYYPSFYAYKYLGFLMVAGFFAISGYGLMYGVLNKENYLKGFVKKRLLSILIPYYFIDIFYVLAKIIKNEITVKYIISAAFGLNLWYVFVITILYLTFYFSFKFFSKNKAIYFVTGFAILYFAVCYVLHKFVGINGIGFWWYNCVICFPMGMWYCKCKRQIDEFLQKRYMLYWFVTIALIWLLYPYICRNFNEGIPFVLVAETACSAIFTLFIILFSYKFQIGNKVLNICGDLSLELYLSHALFVLSLRRNVSIFGIRLYVENNLLYFVLILAGTFVFSLVIHKLSKIIIKKINATV